MEISERRAKIEAVARALAERIAICRQGGPGGGEVEVRALASREGCDHGIIEEGLALGRRMAAEEE